MDDNSIMPFGKHKGKALVNIPAQYLIYIYENKMCDYAKAAEVKAYIKDNLDALRKEKK